MPDLWMDVDAALAEVPVNKVALIDDTDFKTREESVTFDQAGMDLVWNFVTTAGAYTQTAVTPTTAGVYDWTNEGNGMYAIEIPASAGGSINNDTEGFGWFTGFATGILPWTGPVIGFRDAGLNNLLIDSAHSATRGLAGTAVPDAAADAAGGLPISDAGELDLDARVVATDIVSAGPINTNSGSVSTVNALGANAVNASSIATDAIDADAMAANALAEIADAVWNEDIDAAHQTANTAGKRLDDASTTVATNLDAQVSDQALASVCTEARLSELDGAKLPTDVASVQADTAAILIDTAVIGAAGAGLTDLGGMSAAMKAEVLAELAAALVAIHLDHLLAVDYDPASKPGAATALLNELIENDGGVSRYTTNALEQAPAGGGGGETQLRTGTAQAGGASTITLDAGASAVNDFYKHAILAITGATGAGQGQIIDSYVGATKVATMAASWATAPDATSVFVILPLGTIPGASAPSAATVATAVWAALRSANDAGLSMGEALQNAHAAAVNAKHTNRATGALTIFEDDGVTPRSVRTLQEVDDDTQGLV